MGYTPLINASYYGHFEVVKILLEKGADIEARNNYGDTPLICASRYGTLKVVKYLLENGADMEAKNNSGNTFFSYVSKEKIDVIEEYLQDIKSRKMMVKPCRKR